MSAKRAGKEFPKFSVEDKLFGIMKSRVECHTVAMVTPNKKSYLI